MLEYVYICVTFILGSACTIFTFLFKDFLTKKRERENEFKKAAEAFRQKFKDDWTVLEPTNPGVGGHLWGWIEYLKSHPSEQRRAAFDFKSVLTSETWDRLNSALNSYHTYCAKKGGLLSLINEKTNRFKTDQNSVAKRRTMLLNLENVLEYAKLKKQNVFVEFLIYLKELVIP